MLDNKLLICRKFDRYDDTHRVIELAIPVEIYECSAYRVAEKKLDALSEAVLGLMNIDIISDSEIAKIMDISIDLVRLIKKSVLRTNSYISENYKMVTDLGKKYLLDGEGSEYQNEKVFGNMFVSILDCEIMPYFLEGKLPSNRFLPKEMCKLITANVDKEIVQDYEKWTPKFAKAYQLFAKISRYSDDETIDEIEFASEEFNDVLYEDVSDSEEEIVTLDKVKAGAEAVNSYQRLKLLKTTKKQAYLKTKIIFDMENPESFTVLSPFEKNITNWFTKRLAWLRENDIKISDESGKVTTLKEMLEDVTEEFYIQFPELQADNFDCWVSIEYPNLKRIQCQQYLIGSFKGLYNLINLYNTNQVEATVVIIKFQKLLETVLNNYIEISCNKKSVIDKCNVFASSNSTKIKDIFKSYGITDCVALRHEKWKESLRNFSRSNVKYGSSVVDRYFYLTVDAYLSDKSLFRRILERDGAGFITKIDFLNRTRNKEVHSDDVTEDEVLKEDFDKYRDIAFDVLKELINTLYEEEQNNDDC
jgi:hypothetical protein